MRRRTTSYDKSYVGSSEAGLKSEILRKGTLKQMAAARRGAGFVRDLVARRAPMAAQRDATMEMQALARDIVAGRLTIAEARAQLRGAA